MVRVLAFQLHRFQGYQQKDTADCGRLVYLWGSFDTGSMYTHSLLVKVLSIQGFWDCGEKKRKTFVRETAGKKFEIKDGQIILFKTHF